MDSSLIIYRHDFTRGPQLPHVRDETIALAEAHAARKVGAGETAVTVAGSSPGGFYATVLTERHGWQVLSDPVLDPAGSTRS